MHYGKDSTPVVLRDNHLHIGLIRIRTCLWCSIFQPGIVVREWPSSHKSPDLTVQNSCTSSTWLYVVCGWWTAEYASSVKLSPGRPLRATRWSFPLLYWLVLMPHIDTTIYWVDDVLRFEVGTTKDNSSVNIYHDGLLCLTLSSCIWGSIRPCYLFIIVIVFQWNPWCCGGVLFIEAYSMEIEGGSFANHLNSQSEDFKWCVMRPVSKLINFYIQYQNEIRFWDTLSLSFLKHKTATVYQQLMFYAT